MIVENTQRNSIQVFKDKEELLDLYPIERGSYFQYYQEALSRYSQKEEYHEQLDGLNENDPDYDEKYDKMSEKIRKQAKNDFDENFANNMNQYGKDWPSPRGVEPICRFNEFNPELSPEAKEKAIEIFENCIVKRIIPPTYTFQRDKDGNAILKRETAGEWALNLNLKGIEAPSTPIMTSLNDEKEENGKILLYDLYQKDISLLELVEDLKNARSEISVDDLTEETQKLVRKNIEHAEEIYAKENRESRTNAVIEWAKENGYDHMIFHKTQQNDEYYFAKPNDILPKYDATKEYWTHVDIRVLTQLLEIKDISDVRGIHYSDPIPKESYEEMYARDTQLKIEQESPDKKLNFAQRMREEAKNDRGR